MLKQEKNIWVNTETSQLVHVIDKSTVNFEKGGVYHVVLFASVISAQENTIEFSDDVEIMRIADFTRQYKVYEEEKEYMVVVLEKISKKLTIPKLYLTLKEVKEFEKNNAETCTVEIIECTERLRALI